ncbi:MAG: TIGR01777 family protein [Legionella sp.]|nr:MAG: TIGR01777 family protein [Legionella sp.]PJD98502.1 MAG: TIGR01777 family protein [Legionella sp.]
MKMLIAGASGFIGKTLVHHFAQKYQISVLGRSLKKLKLTFSKDITQLTWEDLSSHDAKPYDIILNLTGSSIGDKRWNPKVKKELIESRTDSNQKLLNWLIHYDAKPRFFCANAIGIYGAYDTCTDAFDENTALPQTSDDFLQQIGLAWEQSLNPAQDAGIPVTVLRFGVVLKQGEGMLKKLELPFRLGLGSILGNGQQILSWIYYKDLIHAIDFLITQQQLTGPVNITSPYPVTQKEFAQQLATTLHKPLFLKTPAFLVRILFGEMGSYLLLKGQKVLPHRLNELGFKFTYPKIESALLHEFHKQ